MPSGSQTLTATLRRPRKQFWRDVLIFALLGPVFGLVAALWGIPLAFIATGSRIFHAPAPVDLGVLKFLPLGYYIGLLPALVAGFVHAGLSRRGILPPLRLAIVVVGVGAVAGYVGVALAIGGIRGFNDWLALSAAAGAVAATLCFALCEFLDLKRLRRARSL
ncbi:hypothetical protein GGR16_003045 [Chelatococcus caeni]|uniref:Uncharacterized protein n=1 Tax=Chelatococcus caeni TaxID=1348468 RepID=A0A840BWX3_9HYPH|nr:hypothetical protein [Chelatococcus caeni]MBB4018011.1 hypothetical protein [Chelatococcus caeni]